jgi:hypothetical protein
MRYQVQINYMDYLMVANIDPQKLELVEKMSYNHHHKIGFGVCKLTDNCLRRGNFDGEKFTKSSYGDRNMTLKPRHFRGHALVSAGEPFLFRTKLNCIWCTLSYI